MATGGPEGTRRRLEQMLREADDAIVDRPVQADAPILRARRAIRARYALITVGFVALSAVLTAGAVAAREVIDGDDTGPTGPTETGTTGPTTTTGPPPDVTIDRGPGRTNQNEVRFFFTIEGPGTATAECAIDQGAFEPCVSGATFRVETEGEHLFKVRSVDEADQRGRVSRETWVLDQTGPIVTFTNAELEFATQALEVACSVEGISFSCDTPAPTVGEGSTYLVRLTNGTDYELRWVMSPIPTVVSFSGVGDEKGPNTSTLQLTFELDEPGRAECTVAGISTTCESSVAVTDELISDEHQLVEHSITVMPTDDLGNPGTAVTYVWSFDITSIG